MRPPIGWEARPRAKLAALGGGGRAYARSSDRQGEPCGAPAAPRPAPPRPARPALRPASRRHARRSPRASHPQPGDPQLTRRPAQPGPAAGRITVTKHFLRRDFCLVIVFQETTPSVGSQLCCGGRSCRSRSHQRVFSGPPLRRLPASRGPQRRPSSRHAGRAASRSALQPRDRVCGAASFPPAAPSPPGPLRRPLPWTPTAARPGRSWRGPAPCTCRQGTC